jgi:hypothetical protein
LLNDDDLKRWLHRDLTQLDKLLLILAVFDAPCQISDIRERAYSVGFKIPSAWNSSARLARGRSSGLVIGTPRGWEITEAGKQHLRNLGVTAVSAAAMRVATDLRLELAKIKEPNTRAFAEEAVKGYEDGLHRSAIVMSWLAAVDVLYHVVITQRLADFNKEAQRSNSNWKAAQSTDDLGRMKESDFLDRLVGISLIGKNVKLELKNCLDRRNGCGHPNSLKIGPNTVAHHLEILLLNVFQPFA